MQTCYLVKKHSYKSFTLPTRPYLPLQVQIINPKEFAITALNVNSKTFIMHMAIQKQEKMPVHFKKQALVGALLFDKAFSKILAKYSDNNNVFFAENIAELPENTGINEHAIKVKKDKQSLFGLIYRLGLVELETLKTNIKINLTNGFIWLFKFPVRASIFFNKKPNKNFCFY